MSKLESIYIKVEPTLIAMRYSRDLYRVGIEVQGWYRDGASFQYHEEVDFPVDDFEPLFERVMRDIVRRVKEKCQTSQE